jgi:hypothetical protein
VWHRGCARSDLQRGGAHARAGAPGGGSGDHAVAGRPKVQKLLDALKADHERSIEDLKMLTEIEAPPFKEQKRAEAFLARMKALGLADAQVDAEGNVVGLRKGTGGGPKLLVTAHLDTVFPVRHRCKCEGA